MDIVKKRSDSNVDIHPVIIDNVSDDINQDEEPTEFIIPPEELEYNKIDDIHTIINEMKEYINDNGLKLCEYLDYNIMEEFINHINK